MMHKGGQLTEEQLRGSQQMQRFAQQNAQNGFSLVRKAHVSSATVLPHQRAWSPTAVGVTVLVISELLIQLELSRVDAAFYESLRALAEAAAVREGFLRCRRCALVENSVAK